MEGRELIKISEITIADVAKYLRLEDGDYDVQQVEAIMVAAKSYIVGYTGIPASSEVADAVTLDSYADFWVAYMVLCQDMYDNRSMYPDVKYATSSANRVVESILGMHVRNLL